MTARYPNLFKPLKLGPITIRNRVVMPGHSMRMGDHAVGVSSRYHEYLCRRARGGAALVGIESAPIHESTLDNFDTVNLISDDVVPSLRKTGDEVRAAGSRLSIILWHGGHNVGHRRGYPAFAPSPIPSPTFRETPKAMTASDIREVVRAYSEAARRCREAGIDLIEVQTATDYLLGSFLSPTLNRRRDAYGGTLENRSRIVEEVLEAVRQAAGDGLAVGVRTSAAHLIAGDPSDYGVEASSAAMSLLQSKGLVDYVSVITGSHYSFGATIPPMHWKRPQIAEEGRVFKEKLSVPVIIAGRIRTPSEAEALLANGAADAIGMARSWIAEPDWMLKVEKGEEDSIRPCMSCNQGCLGNAIRNLPGTCVINPEAGREFETSPITPSSNPQRLAVVGGGPAGLELARIGALRGHKVTLYEASEHLGGQMRLAASAPHRAEMQPAIDWWTRELKELQVEIVLNHRVHPKDKPDCDIIVWAIGGRPAQTQVWRLRPHLEHGIPGANELIHGRDVMAGHLSVKGRVLIIDEEGGWPAISLAEMLSAEDSVTHLTMINSDTTPGGPDLAVTFEDQTVLSRLRRSQVELHSGLLVDRVLDRHVELNDGRKLGPFDAIILSTGTLPEDTPEDDLRVGDCVTPRGIWAAVSDSARLARQL